MQSRKRSIIIGSAVVVVLIVGITAFALTRGDSSSSVTKTSDASKQSNDNALAAQSTTTSAAAGATTTTTSKTDINKTKEPVAYTFRAPVHCSSSSSPQTGSVPGDSPNAGKKWVTVQKLDGACDSTSPSFNLRAIDTRLVWRSDAPNFAAFLLDAKGADSSAGYADAECSGPCSDYQSLTNQAGNYTLRVQAGDGPWEVLVQEYR